MPVSVVNGVPLDCRPPRTACLCEWCGEPVSAAECCALTQIFEGTEAVLIRLCPGCMDVALRLGSDGLVEED